MAKLVFAAKVAEIKWQILTRTVTFYFVFVFAVKNILIPIYFRKINRKFFQYLHEGSIRDIKFAQIDI